MPKSKYPQALDTSVEIPPVRDNVLEVGSEVINSLRSAIFNIEKVLGINPQGAAGNTVAQRISKSLDGNGNIKIDALSTSNILSGPILDNDVSSVASIRESKLRLDFPTSLLQSEISSLNSELDVILSQLENLSVTLSTHINSGALNRHPASSISVSAYQPSGSPESLQELAAGSVQGTFNSFMDQHISYNGSDISEDNNSHSAGQIFFDNSNLPEIIMSNSVQGAIEEIAGTSSDGQLEHQDLHHSNGILKRGVAFSPGDRLFGEELVESSPVSFVKSLSTNNGISEITFTQPTPIILIEIQRGDILTISDASLGLDQVQFEVESFVETLGNLDSVKVFGIMNFNSTSLSRAKITKNLRQKFLNSSLVCSVREEATLTSSRTIQIANPDSPAVISNEVRPMEITTSNRFIVVSTDEDSSEIIDLYTTGVTKQSIDTIVSRINEQCAERALNFLAYRIDSHFSSIALVHNLPISSDDSHSIRVSRGSDGGIDACGFSESEDLILNGSFGQNYYIAGKRMSGLSKIVDSNLFSFSPSSFTVVSSSGIDLISAGVRIGSLVNISNSSDDGTYRITAITSNQITINSGQLPVGFSDFSTDTTRIQIYNNTCSFDSITFDKVSATFGSTLADVFMSQDGDIYFGKKLEYSSEIFLSTSVFSVVDFDGDVSDKQFLINITETASGSILVSLDSGESVDIIGINNYFWLESGSEDVRLRIFIPDVSLVSGRILSLGGDINSIVYGFEPINDDSNLLLSRAIFNNFNGRFDGSSESSRVISKVPRGTVSIDNISQGVKSELLEEPINNLRTNGVVSGLEISSGSLPGGLFSFNVSSGSCYVNGRLIQRKSASSFITDIDSSSFDKIFIFINQDGEISALPCTPSCGLASIVYQNCVLATIEFDNVNLNTIDLRLFISNIDLKILNSINVSAQDGMGHFKELPKAISYARRFSQLFPSAGIPSVHLKSGIHSVIVDVGGSVIPISSWVALPKNQRVSQLINSSYDAGMLLDFPVKIFGEGTSSVLSVRFRKQFTDGTLTFRGQLIFPGNGAVTFGRPISKISDGAVSLSDLVLDNCGVYLPDLTVTDALSNSLNFEVNLSNVLFNMRNYSLTILDTQVGDRCIDLDEVDNIVLNKGNLNVSGCSFNVRSSNSLPIINIPTPSRVKNMKFIFNKITGSKFGSGCSLFSQDILTFNSGASNGANISIIGNSSDNDFNSLQSQRLAMIDGGSDWGDRVENNVYVGDNLQIINNALVSNDLIVSGDTTSTNYLYGSPKIFPKLIYFDQVSSAAMGSTSPNAVNFGSKVLGPLEWRTLSFTNAGVGSQFARLRLNIPFDQRLASLQLFTSSNGILYSSYTVDFYSITSRGVGTFLGTLAAPITFSPPLFGALLGQSSYDVGSLNIIPDDNFYIYIQITRNTVTGFGEDLHYVRYSVETSSVEGIVGAL